MIPDVLQFGDVRLKTPSSKVPNSQFRTKELKDLIKLMFECMEKEEGVGLAAPQIGINQRIFVYGLKPEQQQAGEEPIPYTVAINPTITYLSPETETSYEGCLSIKGKIAEVARVKKLKYQAYDEDGNFFEKEVFDYHARIVQHEYDHIEGILISDRAKALYEVEELLKQQDAIKNQDQG